MARNSVTGCFRDIEISFSTDIDCIRMSLRNLIMDESQVRVMYQKHPTSGLANWKQLELTNKPVSLRLPSEVLEAYRLTFFVDDAEPISARVEKILAELETPSSEPSVEDLPEDIKEDIKTATDMQSVGTFNEVDTGAAEEPETVAAQQTETILDLPEIQQPIDTPSNENIDVSDVPEAIEVDQAETTLDLPGIQQPPESPKDVTPEVREEPEVVAVKQVETIPHLSEIQHPKQPLRARPKSLRATVKRLLPSARVVQPSTIRKVKPDVLSVASALEFKISVPTLPPSARAKQRRAQVNATQESAGIYAKRTPKEKENGLFGQIVRTLKGGIRGKAYYQEKGETIQNEFQDQLSKLERDYNEGYGLNLMSWKPETLCEEETAIFLLNLMVNEVIAWQKETGRATPETEGIVETLAEVDTLLRQTLKQTRGISTPSPTLFPNLLAENQKDLEKILSECDAYLQRFTSKLIEQEKNHATKIEILSFRKFLTEFIRDFLFAQIANNTLGNALPKRLNWFLELVNSEVMPIEIGKTKVLPSHHKVKDARPSECESGTIVEIITPGLQSKDGKRVNQMAVVIEAE
ncbi:MAG: hypothetical protein OXI24_13960 [Candidatus Poribacteria bacterium]|nr:hypothetical protein [Candidatus Poribacteria bacterium]